MKIPAGFIIILDLKLLVTNDYEEMSRLADTLTIFKTICKQKTKFEQLN